MALQYGFYNSLNGDRTYDAKDFSEIFNGIINDGVFQSVGTAFIVKATTGIILEVGIGRAWFDGTWTYNDSIMTIQAPASDLLYDRIDALVLEVDQTNRENSIKFVQGEARTNPVNPPLTKTTYVNQYPLCYISRKANSTTITQSQITNKIGSADTPFVTGILKTISMDQLLGQWEAELDEFVDSSTTEMNQWFANKQIEYDNWVAAKQGEYDAWITKNQGDFEAWFAEIQEILNENMATNLQNQIDSNLNLTTGYANSTVSFPSGGIRIENDKYTEEISFPSGTIVKKRTMKATGVITTSTTSFPSGTIVTSVS